MTTYQVVEGWSGYSRGYTVWTVEADSEQEALDTYDYKGIQFEKVVVRDDTESDGYPSATLIEENE